MAPRPSAGILLYRHAASGLEVFIAHMGGPFWARKDDRAWSIPKGELEAGENAEAAARREFAEEHGIPVPAGTLDELGTFRSPSGKMLTVFTAEADDVDLGAAQFGTFELEWPRRSGRIQEFPEVDDARWVPMTTAREKVVVGQVAALDALTSGRRPSPPGAR